eukprot:scaffold27521_cov30-Tisochrysis_lutea.AAC.10
MPPPMVLLSSLVSPHSNEVSLASSKPVVEGASKSTLDEPHSCDSALTIPAVALALSGHGGRPLAACKALLTFHPLRSVITSVPSSPSPTAGAHGCVRRRPRAALPNSAVVPRAARAGHEHPTSDTMPGLHAANRPLRWRHEGDQPFVAVPPLSPHVECPCVEASCSGARTYMLGLGAWRTSGTRIPRCPSPAPLRWALLHSKHQPPQVVGLPAHTIQLLLIGSQHSGHVIELDTTVLVEVFELIQPRLALIRSLPQRLHCVRMEVHLRAILEQALQVLKSGARGQQSASLRNPPLRDLKCGGKVLAGLRRG